MELKYGGRGPIVSYGRDDTVVNFFPPKFCTWYTFLVLPTIRRRDRAGHGPRNQQTQGDSLGYCRGQNAGEHAEVIFHSTLKAPPFVMKTFFLFFFWSVKRNVHSGSVRGVRRPFLCRGGGGGVFSLFIFFVRLDFAENPFFNVIISKLDTNTGLFFCVSRSGLFFCVSRSGHIFCGSRSGLFLWVSQWALFLWVSQWARFKWVSQWTRFLWVSQWARFKWVSQWARF